MEEFTHDFLSFLPAALLALAAAGAPEVYKLAARRFLGRAKSHTASWLYILLDSFLTPVAGLFRVLLGAAAVKSLPFELVRDANVALDENSPKQAIAAVLDALGEMAGVFGILTRKADGGDEKVKALIEARAKARAEKNWAESDRLRDEITALGYVLKDTKQGQQVTKAI